VKDLHPKLVIQKLKESFKAVFGGDGTNEQFIEVFIAVLLFSLLIVSFFIFGRQ
jgi:hypothetical protein